jgi:Na+/proline symporter
VLKFSGSFFIKPEIILILTSLVLFFYTGFGGLRAVVATDKLQLWLIALSLVVVLLFLSVDSTLTSSTPGQMHSSSTSLSQGWKPAFIIPISLALNMLFVNLCYLPTSLRVWQIVSATTNSKKLVDGIWSSLIIMLLITLAAIFISHYLSAMEQQPDQAIQALFRYMVTRSWISAYILYPLFLIGLLSAMLSTADSAILPISQNLYELSSRNTSDWSRRKAILFTACIIGFVNALYFLVTKAVGFNLTSWVLTVFSVTTCVMPAIILPLFIGRLHTSLLKFLSISGAMVGFAAALLWSIVHVNSIDIQPWNSVIGLSLGIAFIMIGLPSEMAARRQTAAPGR